MASQDSDDHKAEIYQLMNNNDCLLMTYFRNE